MDTQGFLHHIVNAKKNYNRMTKREKKIVCFCCL